MIVGLFACLAATAKTSFADDYRAPNVPAPLILLKIRSASGHFEPGTYRITAQSQGHGTTQTRITIRQAADNGDFKTTATTAGSFTTAFGSIGGNDWSMDENGLVVAQSRNSELRSVIQRSDDEKYEKVLGISAQTGCLDVDVNPPNREHTIRCFDPQTYLLRQTIIWGRDLHKQIATFSDYRLTYGKEEAFAARYSDGRPENDTTEQVVSVEKLPSAIALAPPVSKPLFDVTDQPVELPAKFADDGHIFIRVDVAGRGLDFTLDTGAGGIILDPGVAHQLGLQTTGRFGSTIGGDFQGSLARVPQIDVGKISMHDVAVTLAPLSYVSQSVRESGLLGRDFLASGIVEIDFKKRQVHVWPRDAFERTWSNLQPAVADFSGSVPAVQASFEGILGKFLFDTGAGSSFIYRPYMEKLPTHFPNGAESTAYFVGGAVQIRGYRLQNLSLGPILFQNVDMWLPLSSTAELGSFDGILGRDVLSSYHIFIDYQTAKLYLLSS